GDVEGTTKVGGLIGINVCANISSSHALGDVSGTDDGIGGFVGGNGGTVEKCYSTGDVTSSSAKSGSFVGANGDGNLCPPGGTIINSYSTSDKDFYGNNATGMGSKIEGCYATKAQDGVEQHEPEWFNDGSNLTFLGDEFDTSIIPPDLKSNRRPVPPPPPPPPPTGEGIQFQIGANSGQENTLTINTNFSLNGFDADVTTREKANETIDKVDALISEFSIRRSGYGAVQNRLESVMDSLTTKTNNLSASHSTIVDTDFAAESANLVKAQILQNATAALLAQANSAPSIALRLLE
ncbi:MAG: hypothetical protein MJ180_05630, partial [Candidatus Gastranaerophilales bacterium]|nr:hypothetical protein [Candidatus Gastranaerophilales bacterium]